MVSTKVQLIRHAFSCFAALVSAVTPRRRRYVSIRICAHMFICARQVCVDCFARRRCLWHAAASFVHLNSNRHTHTRTQAQAQTVSKCGKCVQLLKSCTSMCLVVPA